MTFEYHIKKIKQYIPVNTAHGQDQKNLLNADVSALKECLEDLKEKANYVEDQMHTIDCIDEGLSLVDELSNELSKTSQSTDRISLLLGLIGEQYREAKRLIAYKD